MTRRFQFSLASLLLTTALIAFAVNWWTLRQRVVAAKERFDRETAFYEVGGATSVSVFQASQELLQAELAMPFVPSDRVAWLSYLDRTRHLFRKQRSRAVLGMLGSEEEERGKLNEIEKLLKECHDVEDRLGLPHIDEERVFRWRSHRQEAYSDGDETADEESLPADEIAPPSPND
jgi:hypothetical protein